MAWGGGGLAHRGPQGHLRCGLRGCVREARTADHGRKPLAIGRETCGRRQVNGDRRT
jgi:hypothetical protein